MTTEYHGSKKTRNNGTTSKPTEKSTNDGFVRIHWVSVTFTPSQKERIKATEFDVEKALDTLAHLVERGYKLVINPKTSQGFVGVSLIGHTDECPDKGWGVSGEGGSFYSAFKSLMAKLDILDYIIRTEDITTEDDFR